MVRDVNGSKKDFYISDKVKIRENVGPLLNETEDLAKQDSEKAMVLNACFASVFSSKTGWPSRIPGPRLGERLEQGKRTLGGRGSGRGTLEQIGRSYVHGP